jgi:hypothetical protein
MKTYERLNVLKLIGWVAAGYAAILQLKFIDRLRRAPAQKQSDG